MLTCCVSKRTRSPPISPLTDDEGSESSATIILSSSSSCSNSLRFPSSEALERLASGLQVKVGVRVGEIDWPRGFQFMV